MKRLLIVIVLLAAPAWAEEPFNLARMSGPMLGAGGSAAADGPNTYYYSCTDTPTSEPEWGYSTNINTTAYCSQWKVSQSGTVTKLAVLAKEIYGNTAKIAIYNTSGSKLSDGCTTDGSFSKDTWEECTLGSAYPITAGDYYLCYMGDPTNHKVGDLSAVNSKSQTSLTYADFPHSSLTLGDRASHCTALYGYVD